MGREDSKGTSDFGVKLRVEEVVMRIQEAEGVTQERFGRGAFGGVAVLRQSSLYDSIPYYAMEKNRGKWG